MLNLVLLSSRRAVVWKVCRGSILQSSFLNLTGTVRTGNFDPSSGWIRIVEHVIHIGYDGEAHSDGRRAPKLKSRTTDRACSNHHRGIQR